MNKNIKLKIVNWALALVLVASACDYNLDQVNPNSPTPNTVQKEEGLKRVALGVWNVSGGFFEWIIQQYHESMGDNLSAPWNNFNFIRMWLAVEKVGFSDGTSVTPAASSVNGFTQSQWIDFINTRQDAGGSGIQYEWSTAYGWNNEANLILQSLEDGVAFQGNAAEKDSAYKAWAYFWKGFAYSRVGLMYERGLIIDDYLSTNDDYKTNTEIIAESNRMFELAIDYSPAFDIIASDVIPDIFPNVLDGEGLAKAAHTLIARNLLSSKARPDLTNSDWTAIRTHALAGIMDEDGSLAYDTDDATYLATVTLTWRIENGWAVASARVVQAASTPGDNRATRFYAHGGNGTFANSVTNPHLNTPFSPAVPYASVTPLEAPQFIVSAEENLLILAEAELALGNATTAAGYVDDVREMQEAGLPALGTATWADIKKERKIALFTRGLAFYDLRRYNEHKSELNGGGITDVWVYRRVDHDNNPATARILERDDNGSIFFNYKPYWPVPDFETTFNPIVVTPQVTKRTVSIQ